jgi:hypothetical protein
MRRALVVLLLLSACGCGVVREARVKLTGASEGTLVANIGMPLEETERR